MIIMLPCDSIFFHFSSSFFQRAQQSRLLQVSTVISNIKINKSHLSVNFDVICQRQDQLKHLQCVSTDIKTREIIEIKKYILGNEKKTTKTTKKLKKKPRNLDREVFSCENWIYKSLNIVCIWFYFTNHINHTWLNVSQPYDNYVAM